MLKANFKTPNGTVVNIEGTPEEVHKLLQFYSPTKPSDDQGKKDESKSKGKNLSNKLSDSGATIDLMEIVNLIKTSDESELFENNILDRNSIVDRTLLPLYIIHEQFDNKIGLTSGDINRITTDLGVPVATPNVSNTLSGTASRYVVGDKMRVHGVAVRYKLSRKGLQYLKSVIKGKADGK